MIYNGDNKEIKKIFQKILIDKNITQTEVAEKMGISKNQLANCFNKVNFSFLDFYKMLNAINCDLEINIITKE